MEGFSPVSNFRFTPQVLFLSAFSLFHTLPGPARSAKMNFHLSTWSSRIGEKFNFLHTSLNNLDHRQEADQQTTVKASKSNFDEV